MIFDRIEARGAGLCAVFRMDLERTISPQGYHGTMHLSVDKKEQAYNEASLVQFIANVERETGRMNPRAVEARLALTELRRRAAEAKRALTIPEGE